MKISVVVANRAVIDPTINPENFSQIGDTWAGWQQWHQCHQKNVICHDTNTAKRMIDLGFHRACKFWIPESVFAIANRPDTVGFYAGDFVHEVQDQEEIVALHIASSSSDIVVMIGFDWEPLHTVDPILLHQRANRDGLIAQVVNDTPTTQWVITDDVPDCLKERPNVMQENVKNLLQDA